MGPGSLGVPLPVCYQPGHARDLRVETSSVEVQKAWLDGAVVFVPHEGNRHVLAHGIEMCLCQRLYFGSIDAAVVEDSRSDLGSPLPWDWQDTNPGGCTFE